MIRVGKLDRAKKLMDGVEAVLGDTAPKQNPREKEYRDRYAELEASLAQALKDPARDASRLRAISAFAIEKSDAGDFDAALKALKQLEEVLGVAPTQEPPPEVDAETEPEEVEEQEPEKGEVDPEQAEFGRRFAELDSRLQEALLARIGNVSAMRSVSGFASEKAEAGEYETALKALDRLERLLDSAGEGGESESGIPYEGLVKYRSALFQFAKAKDKVARQIAALKSAIPAILPEEVETANEVADELAEWNEDLSEAIDQAMNTAEDDDSPVTDAIRAELKKYLDELSSDKLIEQVDQSKFGVPMSIAKTLGDALRNIQQSMPTHA
jgi:tetratricopeptide (TPR) repeat protein